MSKILNETISLSLIIIKRSKAYPAEEEEEENVCACVLGQVFLNKIGITTKTQYIPNEQSGLEPRAKHTEPYRTISIPFYSIPIHHSQSANILRKNGQRYYE